ncbi:MAG: MFS transporter [Betaproteobacteria bacterium]|nr:MFS transporter [Betaproteobacteria bacterium]
MEAKPGKLERRRLPATVVVLSWVSFFNDAASDMVIPLMPLLFAGPFGGGALALGLVEGLAEAVASFMRLWSGRYSDLREGRRKGLALAGYAISNVARPLLGLIHSWVPALLLRSVDRVGKGIRSAPRDALVADATPPDLRARAFGFHRALDNGGAMLGALMAAAVLAQTALSIPDIILASAIPGTLGVLLLALLVKEPGLRGPKPKTSSLPPLEWRRLPAPIRRYLGIVVLFSFARASETFIVLRGHELGLSASLLLVLWAMLNLVKALASQWGGVLADRMTHFAILRLSWGLFALCYFCLAAVASPILLWLVTLGYGVSAGLGEGIERAVVSDFASAGERGTAFGWYNMATGFAAIPAGLVFGGVWTWFSGATAFAMGGVIAALSALSMHLAFHGRMTSRTS